MEPRGAAVTKYSRPKRNGTFNLLVKYTENQGKLAAR